MPIFDHKPQFWTASTPEPSIREIVFKHYRDHFTEEEARKLTESYLDDYYDKVSRAFW